MRIVIKRDYKKGGGSQDESVAKNRNELQLATELVMPPHNPDDFRFTTE
jgi:hypothetical protein